MRILVVEHEAQCPPALVGDWLTDADATLEVCRPYAGDELPSRKRFDHTYDALLVLGGSGSANDDDTCAWLKKLKQLIRWAVAEERPTWGICLGHQIMAAALGGTVARNPRGQQLGVLPVGWTSDAASDPLMGAAVGTPSVGVHWNDDVVTALPPGARPLATAPEGEPQAVRFADRAWGLQLHPEVDAGLLKPWADNDREAHDRHGIDQAALLAGIADARADLDATWQPVCARFVALTTPGTA